ncbi:MAG: hypothetical protein GEV11_26500 [Streptosporangiales bacterium]|nr:hypothetical protein [Streptosporangiales bacterium]
MKADPAAQLRLLDLQELDSALARLAHRRRTLPELAEIARLEEAANKLRDTVVAAETEVSDLEREQRKAENDVEQVRIRARRDQERLDSGRITSPKELSNLQSEIGSLGRRQNDLEDVVLEIMERRETAESQRVELAGQRDTTNAELDEARTRRDAAFAEIDNDAAGTGKRRAEVAADIPGDLLALYDKLRDQFGGVGAAALHRGRCEGCKLALSTVELNRLRGAAEDEVLRCEECRRILVRTPDSGL